MAPKRPPSPERLRELLEYDPKTGKLIWKPRQGEGRVAYWNRRHAGTAAGTLCPDGHIAIKIDDTNYLAHRLIWAMVHGTWPECVVHRNRNRSDNRLRNLQDTSRKVVQRRPVIYRTNTSGIRGVSWNRRTQKWVASIRVDDVTINLGSHDTKEAAGRARREGEKRRDRCNL